MARLPTDTRSMEWDTRPKKPWDIIERSGVPLLRNLLTALAWYSPLGSANDFKYLSRHDASIHPSLGSFWGISDREQGRPTADIRGNLGGPRCGTRVEGLAGRPLDPIDVRPRTARGFSPLLLG
jgi:hypothetical protein